MAFDVLSISKTAEQKASELLHEAQQGPNDMIKNSETKAIEDEHKAALEIRAWFQPILDQRKTQVEAQLKAQEAQKGEALMTQVNEAKARVADTAQAITGEVFNGDH